MRIFWASLAAATFLGCASGAPRFEKQLSGFQSELSIPGVSAAIVKDGRVVSNQFGGSKWLNTMADLRKLLGE